MTMKADFTLIRDAAAECTVLIGQGVDNDIIDRLDFIENKAQECIERWDMLIKILPGLAVAKPEEYLKGLEGVPSSPPQERQSPQPDPAPDQ